MERAVIPTIKMLCNCKAGQKEKLVLRQLKL